MPCGYSWKASQRRWLFLGVLKNKEELLLQIKEWLGVGKDISGRTVLALKSVGTKLLLPKWPLSGRFSSVSFYVKLENWSASVP